MKKFILYSIFIFLIMFVVYWGDGNSVDMFRENVFSLVEEKFQGKEKINIKIANFNAEKFGDGKIRKVGYQFYEDLIDDYDIFFLQEITDKDGNSFRELCNFLKEDYNCYNSSRAGRSSQKEQYGLFYKKEFKKTKMKDYNLMDSQDRWERPPIEVQFDINGYKFTIFNIHTKPKDTIKEINHLENLIENRKNPTLLIGDLNQDCDYDPNESKGDFESWNYIIKDSEDTTSTLSTNCTYDRIIINQNLFKKYSNYGIDSRYLYSNHYLIWIELKI